MTPRVTFAHPGGKKELPFILGILADLSGHPETPLPRLIDRDFFSVDIDNFDEVLAKIAPRLTFVTDGQLQVDLRFRALSDFLPDSIVEQFPALAEPLNAILHSAPFQQLEAAWRGLHYLVSQTECGSNLKILVLNITKKELGRDLLRASIFDQTILFKKVHDDIYGSSSGEPFAAFVLDFAFGPQNEDIQILSGMSRIAAAINAPCIAAASPEMFDLDEFTGLATIGNFPRLFEGALYGPWRRFRESEDSRYVALALPRIAAYAFGARLTAAFSKFGWCAAISGDTGGVVDGLPVDPVAIDEKTEAHLASLGFLPLSNLTASNRAVFVTAHSCHQSNFTSLFSRLDYLLCAGRLAHYLRCMFRDARGAAHTPAQWQTYFTEWISQYVMEGDSRDVHAKARRPLTQARIEVMELPGTSTAVAAVFNFHPHFQLEDPPVGYRVIATLPQIRQAR